MKEYFYNVAGFVFGISLPDGADAGMLLPSFRPFACEKGGSLLFRLEAPAVGGDIAGGPVVSVLDDAVNDMGRVRLCALACGYRIDVRHTPGGAVQSVVADSRFESAVAYLHWDAPCTGSVLGAMLRMVFSQAVLRHGAVSLHASAVVLGGKAFLFMGKSGTGKSTHSGIWIKTFDGCCLLNDDNPVVRVEEGCVTAYGSPWSGKTPCYRNTGFPVGGIARLKQAPENRFCFCEGAEAFAMLLPGCSVIRSDVSLNGAACDTLACIAELVPVAMLECRPDTEAAVLCKEKFTEKINYKKYVK